MIFFKNKQNKLDKLIDQIGYIYKSINNIDEKLNEYIYAYTLDNIDRNNTYLNSDIPTIQINHNIMDELCDENNKLKEENQRLQAIIDNIRNEKQSLEEIILTMKEKEKGASKQEDLEIDFSILESCLPEINVSKTSSPKDCINKNISNNSYPLTIAGITKTRVEWRKEWQIPKSRLRYRVEHN